MRNQDTGETAVISCDAGHPVQAQIDALRHCFHRYGWRHCLAQVACPEGALDERAA